jgi:hypothetical protein
VGCQDSTPALAPPEVETYYHRVVQKDALVIILAGVIQFRPSCTQHLKSSALFRWIITYVRDCNFEVKDPPNIRFVLFENLFA